MEQRSAVSFLRLKGLWKKVIHLELGAVLQENAVSYSNATRFCRKAISGPNSEEPSSSPKDDGLNEVNDVNEPFCWLCPMNPFLLYGGCPAGYAFEKNTA
jgi:hypothetical protein